MSDHAAPTRPILPWAAPSDTFELFSGDIRYESGEHSTPATPGEIQLLVRAGSHLLWSVHEDKDEAESDADTWRHRVLEGPGQIEADFLGRPLRLPVARTADRRGFVMRQPQTQDIDEPLRRVIGHWVNLPHIPFGSRLRETTEDGGWREWGGRHELSLGPWLCRIDSRPDLNEIFEVAKAGYLNITSHVMEIRRADGAFFSASDVADFLAGIQFGMSFAMSRWVAPILPVGYSETEEAVWSDWAPLHIDPPMHGSGRWWVEHRPEDLWSFLRKWIARWEDRDSRSLLSFLITSALASGESAFVEQRLMTTLAAIENLSWVTEVLTHGRAETNWRRRSSDWRIRRLLNQASIPVHINPDRTPTLAEYARARGLEGGPKAVIEVRDHLTHPKDTRDLYEAPGLVAETSRLARRYLDLLLLNHLGYEGRIADRTRVRGWVGESDPSPWATQDHDAEAPEGP